MSAIDVSDAVPTGGPITLFVRGKAGQSSLGKSVKVAPQPVAEEPSIRCAPVDALSEYSADGSLLAVVEREGVRVLRTDGAEAFSTPRPQVQAISLSPRGTFLLTWERQQADEPDVGNLRIWRVATGELACHWHQKVLGEKALWPAIGWSVDEELAYRLVSNEVHFFDGQAPTQAAVQKLRVENVAQCSIEPTGAPHHIATFVPEKKGAPAVLRLWKHGDYGEVRSRGPNPHDRPPLSHQSSSYPCSSSSSSPIESTCAEHRPYTTPTRANVATHCRAAS